MGVDEQNVFNVTVNKGQAIIANDNASVTATANIGADASELEKLIAAVRDKIGTIASDEDKEAASESLEVIEAEVVSEKPKKSMIKTAMATLQAIKGTVELIANALHVMPEPQKALKEIDRVLKDGGLLIAPNFVGHKKGVISRIWSGILKIAGIRFEHQWTSEEYLRWLEFHGWRVRFSKELGARIPLVYTECVRK